MVRTVLPPDDSAASPPVDTSAARLQPRRAGHPRHPSAPSPRSLTLCVDPRRPPTSTSTSTSIPGRPPDEPQTERYPRGNGSSVDGVGPSRVGDVLSPDLCRARTSSCTPTTASRRRASVRLRAVLEPRRRPGCPVRAPPAHCPHVSPLRCSCLWISPSAGDRLRTSSRQPALVHSMWVELSTVIHRVPVGIHIRGMRAPAVDHRCLPVGTNRDKIGVFPPKPVDGPVRTHPVDGTTTPGLCTVLWTAVDEGALGVDGAPSIGGRRVGTDRPPTGAATFPHWTHRFVHTHLCPLTCADTGFPRDPQPL